MHALAIELNDAGLLAVRSDSPAALARPESPGIALLMGQRILTGEDARAKARLAPRFVHSRFWEALDTTPLRPPFPTTLSRADLAHLHLSRLWEDLREDVDDTVLAAPGWYSLEQLGLLLGMAQACGMKVSGMMDSALAAAAASSSGGSLVHLDLHLHRIAATRIARTDEITREETVVEDGVGLIPLQEAWVTLVAQTYVRQTRFDPLHAADTEQRLYDALPRWLADLEERTATTAIVEASGKKHSAELEREAFVRAAAPYYERIGALATSVMPPEEATTLLVSHRLTALPGLVDKLSRDFVARVVALPPTTAAAGALSYRHHGASTDDEGALTFLTSLRVAGAPSSELEVSPPDVEPVRNGRVPTHIVFEGRAFPLAPEPFLLGVSIPDGQRGLNLSGETAGVSRYHASLHRSDERIVLQDHSRFGSFVNGQRVRERAYVVAGDRVRLGTPGVELQLIEVTE